MRLSIFLILFLLSCTIYASPLDSDEYIRCRTCIHSPKLSISLPYLNHLAFKKEKTKLNLSFNLELASKRLDGIALRISGLLNYLYQPLSSYSVIEATGLGWQTSIRLYPIRVIRTVCYALKPNNRNSPYGTTAVPSFFIEAGLGQANMQGLILRELNGIQKEFEESARFEFYEVKAGLQIIYSRLIVEGAIGLGAFFDRKGNIPFLSNETPIKSSIFFSIGRIIHPRY